MTQNTMTTLRWKLSETLSDILTRPRSKRTSWTTFMTSRTPRASMYAWRCTHISDSKVGYCSFVSASTQALNLQRHNAIRTDHYCMVFETLGVSLYDLVKQNDYKRLPLSCVRDVARQLLQALNFLQSINMIHTGEPSYMDYFIIYPFACFSFTTRLLYLLRS